MPGHKGSRIFRENGYGSFLDHIMDCDITEIPGADNLFQPETIIKETMEKYCRLYDVKKTYLLINGSSTGLIASILAAVPNSTKLSLARNCHKSIFNALALGNIQPVYAYPEMVEEYGILGAVSAEEIAERMDENPEAEAVVIPSPNYYGICSDIQAIAEEVHRRGKILIVDQAHGAHLKFFHDQTCDEHRHHAEGAVSIECRRAQAAACCFRWQPKHVEQIWSSTALTRRWHPGRRVPFLMSVQTGLISERWKINFRHWKAPARPTR